MPKRIGRPSQMHMAKSTGLLHCPVYLPRACCDECKSHTPRDVAEKRKERHLSYHPSSPASLHGQVSWMHLSVTRPHNCTQAYRGGAHRPLARPMSHEHLPACTTLSARYQCATSLVLEEETFGGRRPVKSPLPSSLSCSRRPWRSLSSGLLRLAFSAAVSSSTLNRGRLLAKSSKVTELVALSGALGRLLATLRSCIRLDPSARASGVAYSPSSSSALSSSSSTVAPSHAANGRKSFSAVPKHVVPPGEGVMLKTMPASVSIRPSPSVSVRRSLLMSCGRTPPKPSAYVRSEGCTVGMIFCASRAKSLVFSPGTSKRKFRRT
mmetsp:Transcript_98706/g.318293  ORF Transcript_98706/g.318293 Transcript_98706/m.318293 type:complete len:323 (-) Transcript_98706:1212-2180(-)